MSIYDCFDQATLDREYAPSSCIDDINVYLAAYRRESDNALISAGSISNFHRNLRYGPTDDELVDLFTPSNVEGSPLHIYIHGGYWQALHKDDSLFAAPMFLQQGASFAAINYTLAPAAKLTEIVDQNRRAIRWLHENAETYGFDRDRIFLSGSSAGAHLVMMMLLADWTCFDMPADAIKGACAVSGVFDLEPVRLSYVNDAVQMDADEAAANSPMRKPLLNHCPVVLAYGDNETSEFKRQTDEYRGFLEDCGESVTFQEIEKRNHFDVIMDLMHADSWLATETLRQMGLNRQ